jgi:nucleoside-diphosphate-sugar epimerase
MKRCLVTGADGFIGKALCRRLDESGVQVLRMVHRRNRPDVIAVDLGRDPIPSLNDFQPEVVFHLAGPAHRFDSNAEQEHMRITVEGTRDLLNASQKAGVETFVFFSTCAVLGEGAERELDETDPPSPVGAYGRAKLAAEELVVSMNGTAQLTTTCLRMPMVYGPGHKGSLPRMINAIESGWFPPLPNYRSQRSMVHVEDVTDAAILVSRRPEAAGKIYIVAEPRAYSSREIYEIVMRSLGRKLPRWHVPHAALVALALTGDAGRRLTKRQFPFDSDGLRRLSRPACYSTALIHRELGFQTSRAFVDSTQQLLDAKAAS